MVEYYFPKVSEARHLGKRISRLDGPVKATGAAKYSSDLTPPGLLHAKILTCPHAHARITKLDVARARSAPGVVVVRVIQDAGAEVQWAHDEIVAVAAETEDQARDALRAITIEYEVLPHAVSERDPAAAPAAKEPLEETKGDPVAAMAAAAVTNEHTLGMPQIAHLCLEPHGQVAHWEGEECTVWASTQAVSTMPSQIAEGVGVPASRVRVRTDYMGGGFGSKFGPDRWGIVGVQLAKEAGRPVKLFLDRDQEVAVSGSRPSAWARIKVGADRDGKIVAWESESWGSGGVPGSGPPPIPYVFDIPNRRKRYTPIATNFAGAKAWRAPNHPQACYLTLSSLDELAARLGMDPVELLRRNLDLAPEKLRPIWVQQLDTAVQQFGWADTWQPRGERRGTLRTGAGVSLHTWGGRGHASACEVVVQPDGAVEAKSGTHDRGTGTRTVIAMVLAETFGLALDQVKVSLGDSRYPQSGPSGGSSTVGGVSASTRRAAQDALELVFARVAPELGVTTDQLEARDGRIQVKGDRARGIAWRDAAARLGGVPVSATGRNPGAGPLNDSGVGGVQMAEVTVDLETGVVRVQRLLAVQDCGLVVNLELAESQVLGGLIMGVSYALYVERIPDPVSGRLLNPNMEFYKIAGLLDVGALEVHMTTGPGHDERGVIGLGEPPVISPGAVLANAVANAIGVRVPELPLTPQRVLEALERAQEVG